MYERKLVEEQIKYGKVSCKVCHERVIEGWNIYKNAICSPECSKIIRDKLLDKCISDHPEMLEKP